MNENILKGKWYELRGNIKQKWSELTDDDIDYIAGKKDVLIGKLQEKYGISKEEAKEEFESFYNKIAPELSAIKQETIAGLEHVDDSVQNFVKRSLYKAIGIAALTGLLIGLRF